ncbi:MAG: hypothetical protein IIA87_00230 [Nanoarchaeota archaeon]|nr:hypothetical protein [Nanoarchaeota archaeon]
MKRDYWIVIVVLLVLAGTFVYFFSLKPLLAPSNTSSPLDSGGNVFFVQDRSLLRPEGVVDVDNGVILDSTPPFIETRYAPRRLAPEGEIIYVPNIRVPLARVNLDGLGTFYMYVVNSDFNGRGGKIVLLNQTPPYLIYKVIDIPQQLRGSTLQVYYLSTNLFRVDRRQELEYLLADGQSYISVYDESGRALIREEDSSIWFGFNLLDTPIIKTEEGVYKLLIEDTGSTPMKITIFSLPGDIPPISSVP